MKKTRVVFFGNSAFSVTILDALVRADFDIVAVIASPDEPSGRGHALTAPPVALYAKDRAIPLVQAKRVANNDVPACDLGIIASYGHIIPNDILDIPTHGTLNVHPSLLPHYRGPTPIQTALANGDDTTGITIMLTDKEVDHGPLIAQEQVAIDDTDDALTLEEKLAQRSADLLVCAIPLWIKGTIQAREQNHTAATFTKMLTKESGHIDWNQPAQNIINAVRAYKAWPTCWNILGGKNFKILEALITDIPRTENETPGDLVTRDKQVYAVAQDFLIHLKTIQPSGSKPMAGSAFLAGLREDTANLKLL
ncbi:MAG: methionyl-tRNA formyltransferase [Patescibacteria group bacterium]